MSTTCSYLYITQIPNRVDLSVGQTWVDETAQEHFWKTQKCSRIVPDHYFDRLIALGCVDVLMI